MTQNKFWLVWSPQGKEPPKKRYSSEKSAIEAGKKLAESYPKQDVFIAPVTHHFKADMNVIETVLEQTIDNTLEFGCVSDEPKFKVGDRVLLDKAFPAIVDDYIKEKYTYKISFIGGGYAIVLWHRLTHA